MLLSAKVIWSVGTSVPSFRLIYPKTVKSWEVGEFTQIVVILCNLQNRQIFKISRNDIVTIFIYLFICYVLKYIRCSSFTIDRKLFFFFYYYLQEKRMLMSKGCLDEVDLGKVLKTVLLLSTVEWGHQPICWHNPSYLHGDGYLKYRQVGDVDESELYIVGVHCDWGFLTWDWGFLTWRFCL